MAQGKDDATAPTVAARRDDVSNEETLPSGTTAPPPAIADDATRLATVSASAYTILGEHGRGGLGRILRARDERTGRVVAIKEMLAGTEDAAARFVREALVTANLQHPAIVPVYEVARWPDGQPFYAMKLVAGRTLSEAIAGAPDLAARTALLAHVAAVAEALAYAHDAGVIHRDLKPSNVLVGKFGETVVIDWGLAKRLGDDHELPLPEIASSETISGSVMGTPAYMPPEQAIGAAVDARADVYAIGAMLYHTLAGHPPYADSQHGGDVITRLRTGKPPAPLASLVPDLPPDLAAIVAKAMQLAPERRYPSAADLAADLRRFMTGQLVGAHRYTTRQRLARWIRRNRASVAVAALATLALGGFGAYSVARIVRERDRAEDAQARAETSDDQSKTRLAISYEDRARVELLAGRAQRALPLVVEAMKLGRDTPATRFLAARAAEPVPDVEASRHVDHLGELLFQLGSHDVLYTSGGQVTRWDPDADRIAWSVAIPDGDIVVQDETGTRIAVSTEHGVLVLDPADGRTIASMTSPDGATAESLGLYTEQNALLATYAWGAAVWSLDSGAVRATIRDPGHGHQNAVLSRDGARLLIGAYSPDRDTATTLWDVATGKHLADLCPRSAPCRSAAWTRDGQRMILARAGNPGDADGSVTVADRDGKPIYTLLTEGGVYRVDLVGELLIVLTTTGLVEAHALVDGRSRWSVRLPAMAEELSAPEDERRISILSGYGVADILDAATGIALTGYAVDMHALQIMTSSDGTRLALAGSGSEMVVIRTARDQAAAIAPGAERVRRLAFTPDGTRLVAASDDGYVAEYDVASGARVRAFGRHQARVSTVEIDRDGRVAMTSSRDGTAALWDLATGAPIRSIAHGAQITSAALSPDGTRLVTGGDDGTVKRWDVKTGAPIGTVLSLPRTLVAVRWSPDGAHLAAMDELGETAVWDAETGAEVRHVAGAPGTGAIDVVFSPDGAYVALARGGRRHALLDLARGGEVELRGLDGEVLMFTAHFDHASKRVVMCAMDGRVRVWDTTGAMRTTLDTRQETAACDFSPDDRLLVTGDVNRNVRVWDADTGMEIAARTASDPVYGVRFSPTGDSIAAITLGPALLWRVPPFRGSTDALDRLARCRSGWAVTPTGLAPAPPDPAACRGSTPVSGSP